jgi:hypothetical protein
MLEKASSRKRSTSESHSPAYRSYQNLLPSSPVPCDPLGDGLSSGFGGGSSLRATPRHAKDGPSHIDHYLRGRYDAPLIAWNAPLCKSHQISSTANFPGRMNLVGYEPHEFEFQTLY